MKRVFIRCLLRFAVVSTALFLTVASSSFSVPQDPVRPATGGLDGRWQATGVPGGPWIFEFVITGGLLSGTAQQSVAPSGLVQISGGRVDGLGLSFKVLSPDGDRTVTFYGRLNGSEMSFIREVTPLPGGGRGGTDLYGAGGPEEFVARRIGEARLPTLPAPLVNGTVNIPCDTISMDSRFLGGGTAPRPFNPGERSGYRVTFSRTGVAEFSRNGEYRLFGIAGGGADFRGPLNLTDFQRLCQLTRQSGFAALASRYGGGSDGVSTTFRITSGNTTQQIVEINNRAPAELQTFKQEMQSIAGRILWMQK